jgi:formylglycine-generating enzyme required for sulfatase activity
MAEAYRLVRLGTGMVLSLIVLSCMVCDDVGAFDFKTPIPEVIKPSLTNGAYPVRERHEGEFSFSSTRLGSGLYNGQYVTNAMGESKPDGLGMLVISEGARRYDRFDGWWSMGVPLSGEYRFANGWKWFGSFSEARALGPLQIGTNWQTDLSTVTFQEALERVPAPPLPPAQTQPLAPLPVDIILVTDPGQVKVVFASTNHQEELTRRSDSEGNMQLALPAGRYHLTCDKSGFQTKDHDLNVGANGSRFAFCRIKLEAVTNATPVLTGERPGRSTIEEFKRLVGVETFPFFLGQTSPDAFVPLAQNHVGKIRHFLQSEPAVAQQPEAVTELMGFWRRVAQEGVEGYRLDHTRAAQTGRLDGNRRFLQIAMGAEAAACEAARVGSGSAILNTWASTESGAPMGEYLPFPRSDHFKTIDVPASSACAGYLWKEWPQEIQEQSVATRILPRMIEVSWEAKAESPRSQEAQSPPLRMVLVPDLNGCVRLPSGGDGVATGATQDQAWRPDSPFYMAVAETSLAQLRLYASWVEKQLHRKPEFIKWFVPLPVTKSLVGAQNCPYMGVTLDEALSFCNWLSFCHGREPAYTRTPDGRWTQDPTRVGFRLPTEREWEYASRFGFDFVRCQGTPSWSEIRKQMRDKLALVAVPPDRGLVYFADGEASPAPRLVDAPEAWLYPLGLRDLCGNAGELCLAETTTADVLRWTVCGGQFSSMIEDAVMPWHRSDFDKSAGKEVGFRVVLPVPLEDFANE